MANFQTRLITSCSCSCSYLPSLSSLSLSHHLLPPKTKTKTKTKNKTPTIRKVKRFGFSSSSSSGTRIVSLSFASASPTPESPPSTTSSSDPNDHIPTSPLNSLPNTTTTTNHTDNTNHHHHKSIVSTASAGSPTSSADPTSFSSTTTYAALNGNGTPLARLVQSAESTVERVIFDFRFLALLAIGGSLAGSVLCFLNGCSYIIEAYKVHWTTCLKGIHTGQMVLRLVEAIDVYLAGTVMLIFAMGLYGLFISNVDPNVHPSVDRALQGSSLFGMFALKERPRWMKISSLDELKTKVGHVIVMILLVKMFERSKTVTIATGMDLLNYSVCIFLSSASLYILHNLHKSESE